MSGFGSRIGQVDDDSIEITEGRMRIEVDSRRPLKFKRKVESPDAENVTIEIKYDMLFKHCTTCALCPTRRVVVLQWKLHLGDNVSEVGSGYLRSKVELGHKRREEESLHVCSCHKIIKVFSLC